MEYIPSKAYKLLLAGLLAASLLIHLAIGWVERDRINAGYGDFLIFYSGAQILNSGSGEQLYNLGMQTLYQSEFNVPYRKGPLPFNHPPYELLLFTQLAQLPYPIANALWAAVNLILLMVIYLTLVPFVARAYRPLFGAMLFCFYPTAATLIWGQDSILTTALLCATFAGLKRGHEGLAGGLLALGLYKPQLVIPSALIFLIKGRWQALGGFAAVGAVLAGLSVVLVGWNGLQDYMRLLSWMNLHHYTISPANMANARGLLEKLLGSQTSDGSANVLSLLFSAALCLWCSVIWRGSWNPGEPAFNLKFAFTTVMTLLASYHLYTHDLTLLLLPLILTLSYLLVNNFRSRGARHVFLVFLPLALAPVVPRILFQLEQLAWAAIALLVFAVVLAREIGKVSAAEAVTRN